MVWFCLTGKYYYTLATELVSNGVDLQNYEHRSFYNGNDNACLMRVVW